MWPFALPHRAMDNLIPISCSLLQSCLSPFSFVLSSEDHELQMRQWTWISTIAIFISTISSSFSVEVPQVHLLIVFGGRESLRSQMPLSLKEYRGLKNNIEHIMLFSVCYIRAITVFRGWWCEICCDFIAKWCLTIHSLKKNSQDSNSTKPAPPLPSLGVPDLFLSPEEKQ